jgi:hypothetical protein
MIGVARAMAHRNIAGEVPTILPASRQPKIPVSCNPMVVSAAQTYVPLAGIIEA